MMWYAWSIKRKHNMSIFDYARMVLKQHYRCAICDVDLRTIRSALDHDHKTEKVREILCIYCNMLLGKVEKNPEIILTFSNTDLIEKICAYINKHRAITV